MKKSLDGSLKASLLALAIASFPFGSHAAGLGGVRVFSGLGQPLRAEIPVSATAEELESLSARVGSPDVFGQAGVVYTPAAGSVEVSVDRRGSRPVLRLSSDRPLNDPFVDLVLEVEWAAGRLMRNFTFLLDPVDLVAPKPVAARVDAATAPPPRPTAAAAVPGRAAADAGSPAAHAVNRGDTLHRIASDHQYDGTSLDQMLVAIAAANRGAFDGGNINRLRAGSVLTIPAVEQVRAVDPNAARREVLAQAADFEAYRRRLAGVAAEQPATVLPPAGQESAGSIVPRVEESPPAAESSDQLRVSSAEGASETGGGDAIGRLQTLEEELVSREKSLEEANARLAQLEQSVRDLRALLELRSEALGQLQQQAGAAPAAAGAPPAEAGGGSRLPPAANAPAATPPESAPGLFEDSRLLAGGGAAIALLLGLLAYRARRRHGSEASRGAPFSEAPASRAVVGTAGGQSVDTGTSLIHTDFSQAGLSAIDTDEGVDPVAEADVYIAYGRDAQAEEILQDALKADPGREAIYTKLLEIYAQRGTVKQFDLVAADLHARTGGRGAEWDKAAAMGRTIDPGNPLYRARSSAQTVSTAPATEVPSATEVAALAAGFAGSATLGGDSGSETEAVSGERGAAAAGPGASAGGLDLDLDLAAPAQDEAAAQPARIEAGEGGGVGAIDLPAREAVSPPAAIRPLEFDFDLNLDDVGVADAGFEDTRVGATSTTAAADWSLAQAETALSFNLDLGDSTASGGAVVARETSDIGATAGGRVDVELSAAAGGGVAPRPTAQATRALDLERSSFDSSLLDFNLDVDAPPSAGEVAALDLTAISLPSTGSELEPEPTQPGDDWAQPAGGQAGTMGSEEVDTKLELARAYDEMGDRDGARELLEEVIREGSLAQQAAARQMIARFA